ncbi:hypothetical protein C8R44DRAFT_621112 [Mycena epipterygia]|nr:hypothetical protein C8R44DRAFT_621112 [Mycena epipterygia]
MSSPTAAQIASQTLLEEASVRFPAFSASDAVTLGLSIRKRFRGTSRHAKGKGLVISIQTIAGHPLFCCTVGDLGHLSGIGDISLDSWSAVEGMINVVKRTGHSSLYVEKGMAAMGKTAAKQMGLQGELRVNGGAFPIWLENAPCCPIAVVACYSGSSQDDHRLVATTVKDYVNKLSRNRSSPDGPSVPTPSMTVPARASDQDVRAKFRILKLSPNKLHNRRGHRMVERRILLRRKTEVAPLHDNLFIAVVRR